MRLPRPRFTVRRMMLAVALLAVLLGADKLRQQSAQYRERAEECAIYETDSRGVLMDEGDPDRRVFLAREAEYYSRLKAKYERAARYPWLPVKPDSPEPE